MKNFTFPKKVKTITFALMAIGVIGIILGLFGGGDEHSATDRFWGNLLVNGFMFFAIALAAMFFYALQYTAEVGWSAQLKRVLEAVFSFLPIGMIILAVVFLASTFHVNHIYHWMDEATTHEYVSASGAHDDHAEHLEYFHEAGEGRVVNDHFDSIIAGKSAYLNTGFWWVRTLIYFAVFLFYARSFRKMSLEDDKLSLEESGKMHTRLFKRSSVFLIFFAVFTSVFAWDWLMSIDTHWFSTMYGWLTFASYWNMAMVFVTLLVLWLRSLGYLPKVNDGHVHDLGKWVFATGLLWVYLWFSQFMLIWYANIPEETPYYITRMYGEYKNLYFTMVFINFVTPFLVLMSRDAKKNPVLLTIAGVVLFLSHFVDFYFLVIPGIVHDAWHGMQMYEIMMFLGFLGLMIYWVLNTLTKAPVVPVNHPFLDESEHHST